MKLYGTNVGCFESLEKEVNSAMKPKKIFFKKI